MSDRSAIEWTEATWNPSTGCDRISAGCDNCYALTLAKRLKAMGHAKYQLDGNPTTSGPGFAVREHPDSLDIPRRWRAPRVVFVNSMSDLFHARVSDSFIRAVFKVMEETPRHTYQVLTKRPKRLAKLAATLPLADNIWLGVSVENSATAWRLDHVRHIDAAVRFVSAEPLLESHHQADDFCQRRGEVAARFQKPSELRRDALFLAPLQLQQYVFFGGEMKEKCPMGYTRRGDDGADVGCRHT